MDVQLAEPAFFFLLAKFRQNLYLKIENELILEDI